MYFGKGNTKAFSNIYSAQLWSAAGGGSGFGSDMQYARVAGNILRLVVYKYGLVSILDAPCGGVWNSWTKEAIHKLHDDMGCFRYHGVDVVPSVIEKNNEAFHSVPDKPKKWVGFSVQGSIKRSKISPPSTPFLLTYII